METFKRTLTFFCIKCFHIKHIHSMKYLILLFPLFCLCFLIACQDKEPLSSGKPGQINFSQMAVGQKSRYLGLTGNDFYIKNNPDFKYSDDTLELEIVEEHAQGFKVKETLHYVGAVDQGWQNPDSVYYYYLTISNNRLKATAVNGPYFSSRILPKQPDAWDGLPLNDISTKIIGLGGWTTDLDYCQCLTDGYAENYTLFGKTYPKLNLLINNIGLNTETNGETYLYSKTNGIVRYSNYYYGTQKGVGWDLIP